MILNTERLVLRVWRPSEDAAAAFAFWGDPEVMRHAGGHHATVDRSRQSLERALEAQLAHGVCLWAVTVRGGDDVAIGCCGFHVHDSGAPGELELAYHFARAHWGRGYATEAARGCIAHAFDTRSTPRVVAWTTPENIASQRVLDKVGFRFTGMDQGERAYELLRR